MSNKEFKTTKRNPWYKEEVAIILNTLFAYGDEVPVKCVAEEASKIMMGSHPACSISTFIYKNINHNEAFWHDVDTMGIPAAIEKFSENYKSMDDVYEEDIAPETEQMNAENCNKESEECNKKCNESATSEDNAVSSLLDVLKNVLKKAIDKRFNIKLEDRMPNINEKFYETPTLVPELLVCRDRLTSEVTGEIEFIIANSAFDETDDRLIPAFFIPASHANSSFVTLVQNEK